MRNNLPFEVVTKTKQLVSNSKSFKGQTLQHVLQVNSLAFFSILCKYGSESILTYSSFISVRHMLEFRHGFQTSRHSDDRTMAIWPIYFTIENWNPQQFWDSYLRPSWDTRDVPYFKGKGLFYRPPLQPPSSFIDPDLVVSTTYLPTLKYGKKYN